MNFDSKLLRLTSVKGAFFYDLFVPALAERAQSEDMTCLGATSRVLWHEKKYWRAATCEWKRSLVLAQALAYKQRSGDDKTWYH